MRFPGVWVLVEGRGSRVQSPGSRVTCRGSRVQSRGFLGCRAPGGRARTSNKIIRRPRSVYVQVKAHGGIQKKRLECLLYVCCSYVCGCLFFYPPTHTFFGSSRHVTHLAYTWTCVCNEPEIKVRQHSREDIKVIYDPGRCYENLPFYFFFFTFYFLRTLDPRHVTLDPGLCTLDPRPSTKTQTRFPVAPRL